MLVISYEPFFETIRARGISQYKLVTDYGFSHGTLSALKQNKSVTIATLNSLMEMLEIDDITQVLRYIPDEK